nr:AraC family transcriptional regulator [Bacteroidota bacterium]
MSFQVSGPSFCLSPYVKQYWTMENCISNGTEYLQRIVPNGLMELIFYLGDKPQALDKAKNIPENACLSGQQKGYYDIIVPAKLSLFSILFQPHGASMFFDIPISEFYDQNIPLKYLLRDKAIELESDLYESKTFCEKINIVENFLTNQLRKYPKKYELNRIGQSIALINQAKGIININFLSSEACLSRKQYERTFLEYIGTSPKQFIKTVRFQNAIHCKSKNKDIQLTELAYDCGYYDQSHMINDFKTLSGMTPKQYFSKCEPYSDYFQ